MSILFMKARKEKKKNRTETNIHNALLACLLTVVRMLKYGIQSDTTKKIQHHNVV